MKTLRAFAEVVGWCVLVLFLLGAIGLGDFSLKFGPAKEARK